MVLTIRLDREYEELYKELREKIFAFGESPMKITPTNTQIIKAMLLYIAKHSGINVDHMEV